VAVPAAPAAAATSCQGADVEPTAQNLAQIEATTLCLLNEIRSENRLGTLHANARLELAAVRHSRDMVQNSYFAHASRDGSDFEDRIRRTGYLPRYGPWMIGENIAWGTEELGTPQAIVNAWMNSPPHRHNILEKRFSEIGVAVAAGNPDPQYTGGGTYTTDFGMRGSARTARKASRARHHKRSRRHARHHHRRHHKSAKQSRCRGTASAAVSICP
jgi:uncharacterized protein YkwD